MLYVNSYALDTSYLLNKFLTYILSFYIYRQQVPKVFGETFFSI